MIYFSLQKVCLPFRWKNPVDRSVLPTTFFSEPHECYCLAQFMHPPPSSLEPRECHCLALFANSPYSTFIRSPMNVIAQRCSCVHHLRVWSPVKLCVALFANSPFSNFIRRSMNSLPSAVHVSSVIKRGASGDWELCFSIIFRIGSFAKHVYVCICILYSLFLLLFLFCFVLCRKKKERRESLQTNHRKGRMDEISVLSLLSSYLR